MDSLYFCYFPPSNNFLEYDHCHHGKHIWLRNGEEAIDFDERADFDSCRLSFCFESLKTGTRIPLHTCCETKSWKQWRRVARNAWSNQEIIQNFDRNDFKKQREDSQATRYTDESNQGPDKKHEGK